MLVSHGVSANATRGNPRHRSDFVCQLRETHDHADDVYAAEFNKAIEDGESLIPSFVGVGIP